MKRYTYSDTGTFPATAVAALAKVLRISSTAENARLETLIRTARMQVEAHCRIAVIKKTVTLFMDGFTTRERRGTERGGDRGGWWSGVREMPISELYEQKREIDLPLPPLVSVTSITTYDDSDAATTFGASNYYVDTSDRKQQGRVVLRIGSVWPIGLRVANAIKIIYEAGYENDAIPQDLIDAVIAVAAYLYANPGSCGGDCVGPCGAATLLQSYVILVPR